MAGNYIVNVPKLKGRENYDEWAFAAENFLILEGIDVNKTEGTVTAETQKAKAKLIMTIDPSLFVHIKSEQTVSSVWTKLKSLFDDSGFTRKINLLRNLISIRLESCDSMTSYVTQVVDTSSKLRRTGFEINDKWIGSLLLAGLPDKYSPMIMAIEHSGIAITADVIKTKLLDMSNDVGSNETDSAFLSRSWQRNKNSGKVGKNAGMSSKGPANVKTIKCYRCKQIGHYKNKCPLLHEKPTNAFNVVFLSGNFSKEEWYVDSGASAHMISSDKNMVNISHNLKTKEIIVANQVSVPVLSSGDTQITTVVNNSEYDISVKGVLCIPALTTNLLSVSQLIENGNKVIFKRKICHIRNQRDELIGIAELVNGVYRLVIKPEKLLVASAMNTTGMIWHRRLGHINSRDLNIMKNGAVKGISYNDKAEIGKLNCTVCCEGKQARLPFPHRNNRSKRVLEIVHADVCGPMETKSIGLSRYFLLFVDDYSRMSFVYFLKNKSEVFNCFRRFKCMVEKQKNTSIKILRTDNGTEFCSNEMSNFLQESGVIHQKTNPYTPQQNGLCERFNRSVVEKARCLLFDKNLDKIFWAEAVHTAVYLKNRSLASGLDQKTPYELWTEEKPDVSHIRIFGSTVMAHVPKEKRLKWDRKAEKHYLVGHADNVKGYRLYNPVTNKIITSRDVSIMETSGHMEMVQAVIDEKPASPPLDEMEQQTSDDTHTDLLQTNATYDNTYVADENTSSSSSDDPSDIISDTEINNISFENELTNEKRERRQPERFGFGNMCVETDVNKYGDQITLQEAMNGTESKEWRKAMKEELQAYEENEAWEVVDRPEHGTVVQCKWVFRKKFQSDNKVRYRARLVAKGFTQKPGIDYNETFLL